MGCCMGGKRRIKGPCVKRSADGASWAETGGGGEMARVDGLF